MTKVLERLFQAQREGPESLDRVLDVEKAQLTAGLAEEARDAAQHALGATDARTAFAGYTVAARIFDIIGAPEKAFENRLNAMQIPFFVAESEDQYRLVYERAHRLLDDSGSMSAGPSFRALTFAADCAYWAADASSSTGAKRDWLGRAFDDLAGAAPSLGVTDEDVSVLRYASVLVVALQSLREVAPDTPTLVAAEARFSAAAQALVKRGLVYPNDAEKTAHIQANLADIAGGTFARPQSQMFGRKGEA